MNKFTIKYPDEFNGMPYRVPHRTQYPFGMHPKVVNAKWINRFIELALMVASWSKDPSTKVGAVIATEDCKVAGIGYNGFLPNVNDRNFYKQGREYKLLHTVHAEQNALANLTIKNNNEPLYIFITRPMCPECAKRIALNGNVKQVFTLIASDAPDDFKEKWRVNDAESILKSVGIEYFEVHENN